MSVQEIEEAIAQLPTHELSELMTWLTEFHAANWDRQIEADLDAGRLDSWLTEVDAEWNAGLGRPL